MVLPHIAAMQAQARAMQIRDRDQHEAGKLDEIFNTGLAHHYGVEPSWFEQKRNSKAEPREFDHLFREESNGVHLLSMADRNDPELCWHLIDGMPQISNGPRASIRGTAGITDLRKRVIDAAKGISLSSDFTSLIRNHLYAAPHRHMKRLVHDVIRAYGYSPACVAILCEHILDLSISMVGGNLWSKTDIDTITVDHDLPGDPSRDIAPFRLYLTPDICIIGDSIVMDNALISQTIINARSPLCRLIGYPILNNINIPIYKIETEDGFRQYILTDMGDPIPYPDLTVP